MHCYEYEYYRIYFVDQKKLLKMLETNENMVSVEHLLIKVKNSNRIPLKYCNLIISPDYQLYSAKIRRSRAAFKFFEFFFICN